MRSTRRIFPLAIALGVGLVLLLWGLATLESIVIDERGQARENVASQEAVLAEYARRTLEQSLQAQLTQENAQAARLIEGAETLNRISTARLQNWIWDNHLLQLKG